MKNEACCRGGLDEVLDPRLFKALAEPTRIEILTTLARAGAEQTVGDVAACCTVDLSVVSRHLATLRDAGVLTSRRKGKQVYYQAQCADLARFLRKVADALDACCPAPPEEDDAAAPTKRGGCR